MNNENTSSPYFGLVLGDGSAHIESASMPARWCANKPMLDDLLKSGNPNPDVIVSVIPNNRRDLEQRFLSKLGDLMIYIFFARAGKNLVSVFTLPETVNPKEYMGKSAYGGYEVDLVDTFSAIGDSKEEIIYGYHTEKAIEKKMVYVTHLIADVPEELFGNAPEWEKRWVNMMFETKPKDQCIYRKRRIFAYSIQPFLVLLFITMVSYARLTCIFGLYTLGLKGTKVKPLFHPFTQKTEDIWQGDIESCLNDGSYFNPKIFNVSVWPLMVFTPVIPMVVSVFFSLFLDNFVPIDSLWVVGIFFSFPLPFFLFGKR